jgi:hypothetical protein
MDTIQIRVPFWGDDTKGSELSVRENPNWTILSIKRLKRRFSLSPSGITESNTGRPEKLNDKNHT